MFVFQCYCWNLTRTPQFYLRKSCFRLQFDIIIQQKLNDDNRLTLHTNDEVVKVILLVLWANTQWKPIVIFIVVIRTSAYESTYIHKIKNYHEYNDITITYFRKKKIQQASISNQKTDRCYWRWSQRVCVYIFIHAY